MPAVYTGRKPGSSGGQARVLPELHAVAAAVLGRVQGVVGAVQGVVHAHAGLRRVVLQPRDPAWQIRKMWRIAPLSGS